MPLHRGRDSAIRQRASRQRLWSVLMVAYPPSLARTSVEAHCAAPDWSGGADFPEDAVGFLIQSQNERNLIQELLLVLNDARAEQHAFLPELGERAD